MADRAIDRRLDRLADCVRDADEAQVAGQGVELLNRKGILDTYSGFQASSAELILHAIMKVSDRST